MLVVWLVGPAAPAPSFDACRPPTRCLVVLIDSQAPDAFEVEYETTVGSFVVAVNRSWAPPYADRFYALALLQYHQVITLPRAA